MWTKNLVFKLFSELGKIWKCNLSCTNLSYLLWAGKNLEVYTAQDQHYKIQILNLWTNSENLCPNLSFAVENKVGNSHKKGWSHFILSINDWDILFPKILRIYQWIRKNMFHWGKWNTPTEKAMKIFISSLCIYSISELIQESKVSLVFTIFFFIFSRLC